MRTKILGSILVVLTVLGGIQLFQNMTHKEQFGDSDDFTVNMGEGEHSRIISKVRAKLDRIESSRERDSEVMIEKTFNVNQGDDLVINIAHADVDIITGNGSEASVVVTLNSSNSDRARARFEDMKWEVYQEGGAVYVKAESPRSNWSFNGSLNISVLITVPEAFNVELQTSHGDVNLADIQGKVSLLTSHGDVDFGGIKGERISIQSSHGDISGQSLTSSQVDVETSHADIEIGEVDAKSFSAATSHANISIKRIVGEADITTSHGSIRVFLAGNESATLSTEHGDIDISMDANAGADLDFEAPDIQMDRNFKVNGENGAERVAGSINGGGRRIQARTTHGSIEMNNQ